MAKLDSIERKDLELLPVEDLRQLWKATRAMLTPELERARARGTLPPIGVDKGKRFLTQVLEPALAAKLQGGEVARLFWPLVEHVMANLGTDRLLAAFLNVLPEMKTYVSAGTGAGPPAKDLGRKAALKCGVPGSDLDALVAGWAAEGHKPSQDEARTAISATMINVPRAIAKLFFEVVSEKEALAAFKAGRAVEGHPEEIRARRDTRVETLGGRLIQRLGELDRLWFTAFTSFSKQFTQESSGVKEAPGAAQAWDLIVGELADDATTVTSCYMSAKTSFADSNPWAADIGGPGLETPDQRFLRALKAMTAARGSDTSDLSPLQDEIWEARLDAGGWVDVTVFGERDGQYMVRPVGRSSEHNEVVPRDRLRPKQQWSKGDQVTIQWDDVFYPGRVLDVEDTLVKVHWFGFDASVQGGWVKAARLRPQGG